MAHECFEDEEVAQFLNRNFISIKVDREERPDIDSVYMKVCQAFTGQGGWPLTIVMTPQQKPFFAGTYFPKKSRYNLPGVLDILKVLINKWNKDRQAVLDAGDEIIEILNKPQMTEVHSELNFDIINNAFSFFKQSFDMKYGGFGNTPKFPMPHNLMFLLRYFHIKHENAALDMAEHTLQQMYKGGIFDHIGGGFSRYSTDEKWLVPHFEKMLYDNALLTMAYAEAYQITRKDIYKQTAVKNMDYILREMTDSEGGFYSAQDADSEGTEGKYYVFKPDEIIDLLGKEDGEYFNKHFDITKKGNFEGMSIPNLIDNKNLEQNDKLGSLIDKVYAYRLSRTVLHKDDKILTSWNGLMIAAFAKAYRAFGDEKYYNAAKKTIDFIEAKLKDDSGRLYVRYRDGQRSNLGHLDDYTFYIWALLEMYDTAFETEYLEMAVSLNDKLLKGFFDEENGGCYLYSNEGEMLISRPKETYDGAVPSGNSVCAYNFVRLSKLTGRTDLADALYKQLQFINREAKQYPAGFTMYLMALIAQLQPSKELICVIKNSEAIENIKKLLNEKFSINISTLVKTEQNSEKLSSIAEFTKDYTIKNDMDTFYICQNYLCKQPFNNIEILKKEI
jgi:uncharacterized protein YyaL (SSP411 family)